MTLLPADYVLAALAVTLAVTGLFRGFSGTLAFVLATASAGAASAFVWAWSADFADSAWIRGVGTLVAALLVFGLVRIVVRKTVNGLLAQPADAVFGFLVGAAVGAAIPAVWAWSGMFLEYSHIATLAAGLIGRGA